MNKKKILGLAGGAIVAVILLIVGWYWYEGAHYVTTDDSRIAANLVPISPEIPGKVIEWDVQEGDRVNAGDVLGRQDLGTLLNTGTINTSTLATIGSIAAEKASIKSPIAGQVIKSSAVVGEMASPGMVLAVVADTDSLYVQANIEETHIGHVKLGQHVDIDVDAYPGVTFPGVVETIGRATSSTFSLLPAQNSGGNYTKVTQIVPIKIHLIDTRNKSLLVGMNTSIRIYLDSTPQR